MGVNQDPLRSGGGHVSAYPGDPHTRDDESAIAGALALLAEAVSQLCQEVARFRRAGTNMPNKMATISNPKIYQLGIQEGERRARERLNGPWWSGPN